MTQILVAISSDSVFHQFEPLMSRSDLSLTRVRSGQHALTLAHEFCRDLILCQHPLVDLGFREFYSHLRAPDSASRVSPLLVVTRGDRREELMASVDDSDEQLHCVDLDPEQVRKALGECIGVAMRSDSRLLVEAHVNCGGPARDQVFQTANVSESGFLLRSHKPLSIGAHTRFALSLPDSEEPVRGIAEIVRHTDFDTEHLAGMGARFLELEGDGRRRLADYLRRHLPSDAS